MRPVIDVTVAAIVERDGRFLMVEEETSGAVVFNQPAGHVEPGDSLIDAVIREALEETGYAFAPVAVVGFYRWQPREHEGSYLRIAFRGTATDPCGPVVLDTGILATHWLSRDQLMAQQSKLRSPMVLPCVDDYLAGQRYDLKCLVDLGIAGNQKRAVS